MKDVIIIGAGVVGSAIAREVSRYAADVLVIERGPDVCEGTSKANSGIVHAGYDAKPGTLKAKLNVEGNRMMEALSKELDFPFVRNTSLVLALKEEDRATLQALLDQGIANGVEGLRIIESDELHEMEPNVSPDVTCALYAPTGGIVDPFLLTVAFAENAFTNGVGFQFNESVRQVEKVSSPDQGTYYRVTTDRGVYEAKATPSTTW